MKESPRQEVGNFTGRGNLRQILDRNPNGLSNEGIDLIVRVVLNYCEPKRKRKLKAK